jgi:hypothetical protein
MGFCVARTTNGSAIGYEREVARLRAEDARAEDVGRHEVGGELDAREVEAGGLREELGRERLGDAGDALDEDVAAGEDGGDQLVDEPVLPDDEPTDLAAEGVHGVGERREVRARAEEGAVGLGRRLGGVLRRRDRRIGGRIGHRIG